MVYVFTLKLYVRSPQVSPLLWHTNTESPAHKGSVQGLKVLSRLKACKTRWEDNHFKTNPSIGLRYPFTNPFIPVTSGSISRIISEPPTPFSRCMIFIHTEGEMEWLLSLHCLWLRLTQTVFPLNGRNTAFSGPLRTDRPMSKGLLLGWLDGEKWRSEEGDVTKVRVRLRKTLQGSSGPPYRTVEFEGVSYFHWKI